METEDGAYPLLDSIKTTTNFMHGFDQCDVGILIGGSPHRPGMERRELLEKNCEIMKNISHSLDSVANPDCKIVMVANPVNSLATVLAHYTKNLPKENITALSRLDYNRAKYIIAKKCNTTVDKVTDLIVWGNHSDTQYPDTFHCKIDGKPIKEILKDQEEWLHTAYVDLVFNRWKRVVEHLGHTSVMGPANAIKDHLKDWFIGTEPGNYVSMAVISNGNYYDVPKNLCFSLPVECKDAKYKIVDDLDVDEFTKQKIKFSKDEIINELNGIGFKV